MFGLSDQFGTLQVGKAANLIVTNGDPLEITTGVNTSSSEASLRRSKTATIVCTKKYLNRQNPKRANAPCRKRQTS